jgi:hypothetical protein
MVSRKCLVFSGVEVRSVSVSGMTRFGSVFSMSVLDFLHLGSSLSLRSFGRMGSGVSVAGVVQLPGPGTYVRYNGGLEMYTGSTRTLSSTSTGGTLHGAWSADVAISTSDRRLKKDIEPLEDALSREQARSADVDDQQQSSVSWVLRELRPVAYRFSRGAESKYMRLGFVAQELEDVLPMLTRPLSDDADAHKGVVMTDLIAVLVSHARMSQEKLEEHTRELKTLRARVAALEGLLARVEHRVDTLERS